MSLTLERPADTTTTAPAKRTPTPGQVAQVQYLYLNTRFPVYLIAKVTDLHPTTINRIVKDDMKFLYKANDREEAELENSVKVRDEEDARRGVRAGALPGAEQMRATIDSSSYRESLKLREEADTKAAYTFEYLMDLVTLKKKLPGYE